MPMVRLCCSVFLSVFCFQGKNGRFFACFLRVTISKIVLFFNDLAENFLLFSGGGTPVWWWFGGGLDIYFWWFACGFPVVRLWCALSGIF